MGSDQSNGDLLGRQYELGELVQRLSNRRLVTVIGPGGIGKTTLAQAAAAQLARRGTASQFVGLAQVESAASVDQAMAAQLGFPSFTALLASPADESVHVLVDNCEHVTAAAAVAVEALLDSFSAITVLATSRSPLDLPGEAIVVLGPLVLPTAGSIEDAASVQLFRRRASDAGATLDDRDLEDIAELCRRLDGVPLAIEIAAARTRTMSPAEITARLDDQLDLLSRPRFRGEPRHQSVRSTIEWSYRMLDDETRFLFERLSVFAGPFSATAAHAVAGRPGTGELATIELVDALVDASLLVTHRDANGTTRYRQLQTLRTFAAERLDDDIGASDETRERFVDHAIELARPLLDRVGTNWSADLLTSLLELHDNFAAALRRCVDHDDEPSRAFTLLTIMWGVLHQLHTAEVCELGETVLARWPDPIRENWADGAATVATAQFAEGRMDAASNLATSALRDGGTSQWAPVTLRRVLGLIRRAAGDPSGALDVFEVGARAAADRDLPAMAVELELLCIETLADLGRVEEALARLAELRPTLPDDDTDLNRLWALTAEGYVMLRRDPGRAIPIIARALSAARRIDYQAGIATNLRSLVLAYLLIGDDDMARQSVGDLLRVTRWSGVASQARVVLAPAAAVLHRTNAEGWEAIAATARSMPAVGFLESVGSEIVPIPASENGPVLSVRDAVAMARRAVDDAADPAAPGGATSPLAGVTDTHAATNGAVGQTENVFRQTGDYWQVRYLDTSVTLKPSKGMNDIARLLATPNVEIRSLDLAGAGVESPDVGDAIDRTARSQYEQRIRDLQGTIEEAEQDNDIGRAERATTELDAIVEHLAASLGLGNRSRRIGGNTERARSAVTKRVRATIRRIGDTNPALAGHLESSIVTGVYCCYRPERTIEWST